MTDFNELKTKINEKKALSLTNIADLDELHNYLGSNIKPFTFDYSDNNPKVFENENSIFINGSVECFQHGVQDCLVVICLDTNLDIINFYQLIKIDAWRFTKAFGKELIKGYDSSDPSKKSFLDNFSWQNTGLLISNKDKPSTLDTVLKIVNDQNEGYDEWIKSYFDTFQNKGIEFGINFRGKVDFDENQMEFADITKLLPKMLTDTKYDAYGKINLYSVNKFVDLTVGSNERYPLYSDTTLSPNRSIFVNNYKLIFSAAHKDFFPWLSKRVRFEGQMSIQNNGSEAIKFTFAADLPIKSSGTIELSGQMETNANLDVMEKIAPHSDKASVAVSLPEDLGFPLDKLKNLSTLKGSIKITLDVYEKGKVDIISLQLGLNSTMNWQIIEKPNFNLTSLGIQVDVSAPSWRPDVTIFAESRLFDLFNIKTSLQLPDLILKAYLPEDSSINFVELLGKCERDSECKFDLNTEIMNSVNNFQISDLEVEADIKYKDYFLNLTIDTDWKLGELTLLAVKAQLFFIKKEVGGGYDATVCIEGYFSIGKADFFAKAFFGKSENSYLLEGGTTPGQQMEIGPFLGYLADKFNIASEVPELLEGITIFDTYIKYDIKKKDFTFTCSGEMPLGESVDDKIRVNLNIDIKKDGSETVGKPTYTRNFSGDLIINYRYFKFDFSGSEKSQLLIASYRKEDGDIINVRDLVDNALPDIAAFVPESLQVTVNDIFFVKYLEKPSDNAVAVLENPVPSKRKSKYIFAVDLAADVSLSNLPLVGQKFPKDKNVGVENLQLLVASKPFTGKTEVELLNDLIPANVTHLPNHDLKKGFNLSASMQFGDTSEILSLTIGGDSQPEATSKQPTTTGDTAPPTETAPVTPAPSSDNAQWFKLQKNFGPLHFERIGVQYQDGAVWFLLDAALSLSGLTLSLDGLAVGSPLTKFEPEFNLKGLGIDFHKGPLEIGGAFLRQHIKQGDQEYDEYDGLVILKIKQLSLSALGAYAYVNDHPSLFIYGVLDYPLGGPAFFFVTGAAAGFGYNRTLRIPTIDQVAQFPLIEEAMQGQALPADADRDTLTQELEKLRQYVPPATGQMFLAVGIKFTSFKIIDSFALLTISFGNRFEVDILGLSTLLAPPRVGNETATPLAEVQLALKATFIPDEGFLSVRAQLTPASYVLSRDCQLTGGFAFYTWFSGTHEGDFVTTLGGYHPSFRIPAHYPTVPRLGFNWPIDSHFSLRGDLYYALCSHALMAGGHLEALYHSGDIKAWFKAGADFLIAWKPYHYDARIYVDIGASYTIHFFGTHHITVEVGADLHLWGPEFGGHAIIHIWVISVHVDFGNQSSQQPRPISWDTFRHSFLPQDNEICSITVKDGLVSKGNDASDLGVINPKHLSLVTNSVIPSKQALSSDRQIDISGVNTTFGIGSMNVKANDLNTTHSITITKTDGEDIKDHFACTPIKKKMPAGLWGQNLTPSLNGQQFIKNALAGFEITPAAPPTAGESEPIERNNLQYETEPLADAYEWASPMSFTADSNKGKQDINSSIMVEGTVSNRNDILTKLGFNTEDNLIDLNDSVADAFLVAPQVGSLSPPL